jgi:hypothetical protein
LLLGAARCLGQPSLASLSPGCGLCVSCVHSCGQRTVLAALLYLMRLASVPGSDSRLTKKAITACISLLLCLPATQAAGLRNGE